MFRELRVVLGAIITLGVHGRVGPLGRIGSTMYSKA